MKSESEIIDKLKQAVNNANSFFENLNPGQVLESITVTGIVNSVDGLTRQEVVYGILALHGKGEVEYDGDEKVILRKEFYK